MPAERLVDYGNSMWIRDMGSEGYSCLSTFRS